MRVDSEELKGPRLLPVSTGGVSQTTLAAFTTRITSYDLAMAVAVVIYILLSSITHYRGLKSVVTEEEREGGLSLIHI